MKPKHVKLSLAITIALCAILTLNPLSAQQRRVGNVSVNNITVGGTSSPQIENATSNDVRSTEPTSPPRPEVFDRQSGQLPLPVIAAPERPTTQQATRPNATRPNAAPERDPRPATASEIKAEETSENANDNRNTPVGGISQAMQLYLDGSFDRAREILENAWQDNPELPPPGIFLAQFAANANQEYRVRHWLDLAAWEHPDDPEAYLLLADFAVNESRLTEAKTLVEKGVSLFGNIESNEERLDTLEMLAESVQGRICQLWEDWDSARIHFEKLLIEDPENADLLARLGFVATNQGQYDDAIGYYQNAIANGAKLPAPKLVISQIADQQGKTDIADKYFNEAMKAADIDPESIRIAVQIRLRRGNLDEAETLLARAVKAEPDNLDNLLLAGTIDMFKKDYAAAEAQFQKAILIAPNSYGAMHGLALALAEQDGPLKKERALTYAKNNVKNSGESPDAVATLAWVYFKSGKTIEAEYFANYVLASGELTPLNAYFLAEIMNAKSQSDKALALVKIATATKNNFMKKAEAETLQQRLEGMAGTFVPEKTEDASVESETPAPIRIPGTRR